MIVAISGKKTSGKNTVAKIWQLLDVYYNTIYYKTHKDKKSNIEFVLDNIGKDHFIYNEYSECCDLGVNGVGYIKYNSSWKQKSFAHKVKQIVSIITGCDIEDLENEEFKNSKLSEEFMCWEINYFFSSLSTHSYLKTLVLKEDLDNKLNELQSQVGLGFIQKLTHKEYLPTYREVLQLIGTDLFRCKFNPNTWVNALFSDYKPEKYISSCDIGVNKEIITYAIYPNWLITDCRFKNEAKAIEDRSGVIIRVNRDTNNKDNHLSETELDNYPFEYVIENNDSIEELIEKVKVVMIDLGVIKDK